MQNSDAFSPLNCIRRSAKQPNKERKKITDKKYRLKKKREREASLGLIMLLISTLKSLLRKCPSCLMNLPSMLLDEAAFCTNIAGQVSNHLKEISKLIEEGLSKSGQTNDEYINPNTLVSLLSNLINQPTLDSHIQRQVHSSSYVGTIISTPGMSHSGNSNLMASSEGITKICSAGSDSIAPTVNTGTILPTGGTDGTLSNGYELSPANFAINSVGNMPSMGVERMTMIPTPGGHLSVESMVVSQTEQQEQFVGGQNSLIPHTFGCQISNNLTSSMQQRAYVSTNGAIMRMIGNNKPLLNEPDGGHSIFESMVVSEPEQQEQFVSGLHTLGSQMSNNVTCSMQQRAYVFTNDAMGMIGNSMPLLNEPGAACEYLQNDEIQEYEKLSSAGRSFMLE